MSSDENDTARFWRSDIARDCVVPVARPKLPSAEHILPFLKRIDESRLYSNGGPLVRELEAELARQFGPSTAVGICASGTLGIALALMAYEIPPGALCMIPAWTFAATAHAILLAGLVPWIVDVDDRSGTLTAELAQEWLARAPAPVGAILPVAPFGRPTDITPWEEFRDRTGIAVVIDAASNFDTLKPGAVPAVLSLHATKPVSTGEGGCVVSTDKGLIRKIHQRSNFGFAGSRQAQVCAMNAKLSEYSAAVGLASLAEWPQNRAMLARVGALYRDAFGNIHDVELPAGNPESWVSSTLNLRVPKHALTALEDTLAAAGIGTRRWWGAGLHHHAAFVDFPRMDTPVTDALAATTLGLPFFVDLPRDVPQQISRVIQHA